MPLIPTIPGDPFAVAGILLGDKPAPNGFNGQIAPTVSGFGTRQSRVQNNRPATFVRHAVYWLVPEGPLVEMYINPQSLKYDEKKEITEQRTRNGYAIQYWGPTLGSLSINGTTGTSGIEGINVLRDVYLAEQRAMDPFNLMLAAKQQKDKYDFLGLGSGKNPISGDIGNFLLGSANTQLQASSPKPSLASLALTVEMYWSGEVYRGYFTDFAVTESADKLGLFDYSMNMKVTQKRGFRSNFLAWHRSATSGQSNSDPNFGTPYSFGTLVE